MKKRIAGIAAAMCGTVLFALMPAQSAQAAGAGVTAVNCVNAYLGNDGYQEFLHVTCSPIPPTTQWMARVTCSNGLYYNSGILTNFREVWVYCPAGTKATGGVVFYN